MNLPLKSILYLQLQALKEQKHITDDAKTLTESGKALITELSKICFDIMYNESTIFEKIPPGTDCKGTFDYYLSAITDNDDITLLAFLYAEREAGYSRLRSTISTESRAVKPLIEDPDDFPPGNVIDFKAKKSTSH